MNATGPIVSVLMPVRDGGDHLYDAMASLVSQTLENFEVIAIDDGSEDDSFGELERWAWRDERIHVVRQEAEGIVRALERARAEARAPFLARMDADDLAEPERLEAQLELMESNPELVGCGCQVEYFPTELVRDGARRYEAWINAAVAPDQIAAALFVECPLPHPTFFLRADCVESAGGYVDLGWPEDYDLVFRLSRIGPLGKVGRVLHRWRESPDRLSRVDPRYSPEAFVACKVHYLRASLLPPGRPAVVWGAGPVGKSFATALQAAGGDVEAFVELDPRKVGQEIHGAPVLDPDSAKAMRGPLHLAAVGQSGARDRILSELREAGFDELSDFVAVA